MKTLASSSFALALLAASRLAAAEPATYVVDPLHSSVTAESRHFGTSTVRSRFGVKSGTVTIDPTDRTGTVSINIDMGSVLTGVTKLDDSLRSDKFFDAASYPDGAFTATKFVYDGEKVAQIVGDLTLRGKTAPVTLTATHYNCYVSPNFKKQVCGGDFEATIKRSQWEINYLIPFVSDETRLQIQVEAVKQ